MDKAKIVDPVGAISIHGVVGIWGLLTVSFTNPDRSLIKQHIGIGSIFGWTFGASLVLWMIIMFTMGVWVSAEEEMEGVDIAECVVNFNPKIKIELVVQADLAEKVIETIREAALSGKIGDGRIFVIPVEDVLRGRTGEREPEAI